MSSLVVPSYSTATSVSLQPSTGPATATTASRDTGAAGTPQRGGQRPSTTAYRSSQLLGTPKSGSGLDSAPSTPGGGAFSPAVGGIDYHFEVPEFDGLSDAIAWSPGIEDEFWFEIPHPGHEPAKKMASGLPAAMLAKIKSLTLSSPVGSLRGQGMTPQKFMERLAAGAGRSGSLYEKENWTNGPNSPLPSRSGATTPARGGGGGVSSGGSSSSMSTASGRSGGSGGSGGGGGGGAECKTPRRGRATPLALRGGAKRVATPRTGSKKARAGGLAGGALRTPTRTPRRRQGSVSSNVGGGATPGATPGRTPRTASRPSGLPQTPATGGKGRLAKLKLVYKDEAEAPTNFVRAALMGSARLRASHAKASNSSQVARGGPNDDCDGDDGGSPVELPDSPYAGGGSVVGSGGSVGSGKRAFGAAKPSPLVGATRKLLPTPGSTRKRRRCSSFSTQPYNDDCGDDGDGSAGPPVDEREYTSSRQHPAKRLRGETQTLYGDADGAVGSDRSSSGSGADSLAARLEDASRQLFGSSPSESESEAVGGGSGRSGRSGGSRLRQSGRGGSSRSGSSGDDSDPLLDAVNYSDLSDAECDAYDELAGEHARGHDAGRGESEDEDEEALLALIAAHNAKLSQLAGNNRDTPSPAAKKPVSKRRASKRHSSRGSAERSGATNTTTATTTTTTAATATRRRLIDADGDVDMDGSFDCGSDASDASDSTTSGRVGESVEDDSGNSSGSGGGGGGGYSPVKLRPRTLAQRRSGGAGCGGVDSAAGAAPATRRSARSRRSSGKQLSANTATNNSTNSRVNRSGSSNGGSGSGARKSGGGLGLRSKRRRQSNAGSSGESGVTTDAAGAEWIVSVPDSKRARRSSRGVGAVSRHSASSSCPPPNTTHAPSAHAVGGGVSALSVSASVAALASASAATNVSATTTSTTSTTTTTATTTTNNRTRLGGAKRKSQAAKLAEWKASKKAAQEAARAARSSASRSRKSKRTTSAVATTAAPAGRRTKGKGGRRKGDNDDDDEKELAEMLRAHNRKIMSANVQYVPQKHSVRAIRAWERESGRTWHSLTPQEREEVNAVLDERKAAELSRKVAAGIV